jgi:dihydropteroate synthase
MHRQHVPEDASKALTTTTEKAGTRAAFLSAVRRARTATVPKEAPLLLRRGDETLLRLDGSRCMVMAILNLTPDSFFDGGRYGDAAKAIARAHALIDLGADILDLGAESTRPGAAPLDPEAEWQRLSPVLTELSAARLPVVLSVDTRHVETARRAAALKVRLLNLPFPQDIKSGPWLNEFDGIVVMHSRGNPATMRDLTDYGDNLCQTVIDELRRTVASLSMWGDEALLRPRLIFDPGIGFAKTAEQSQELLARLRWLRRALGGKVLIGASRKSMLGAITGLPISDRLVPSVVAAAFAAYQGADVVRVHDVAETVVALRLAAGLRQAEETA